ncbi:MAG: HEPN domain-containing protein [Candidatus Latescibacteria bacterium]|nr:HEPN domain-containing protein [Candidatus Latescibacterota bacterium]
MPARHEDWLKQAERDVEHARHAVEHREFEWACFAAQQAAEKALKALYQILEGEGWGHSVTKLLEQLPASHTPDSRLVEAGMRLDKLYIPTRYPNGFDVGAPMDYYTEAEAQEAIDDAQAILSFVRSQMAGSTSGDRGSETGGTPPAP